MRGSSPYSAKDNPPVHLNVQYETSLGVKGNLGLSTIKKKKWGGKKEQACSLQLPGRWQSQRLETLGERTGTKGTRIVLGHIVFSFTGS